MSVDLEAAIARYRTLVEVDEALFDADGNPTVTARQLETSEAAVAEAWAALMTVPCQTLADVRAKAAFLLKGVMEDRTGVRFEFDGPSGSNPWAPDSYILNFLRSLVGEAHHETP